MPQNREEEEWEMSQAELSKLIKEEQEWFDWDIDQRFNDLYAQVSNYILVREGFWKKTYF